MGDKGKKDKEKGQKQNADLCLCNALRQQNNPGTLQGSLTSAS